MANGGLVCSPLYMLYVNSIVGARPVRLIEAYTFRFRGLILRLYSTFNRYPKISLAYTYNRDCTYDRDPRVIGSIAFKACSCGFLRLFSNM